MACNFHVQVIYYPKEIHGRSMFETSKKSCRAIKFSTGVSAVAANLVRTSEERVYQVVLKQAALVREEKRWSRRGLSLDTKRTGSKSLDTSENDLVGMKSWNLLNEAYDRCGEVCAEYAKTFYLVWCRRTDELVDGPNASHITSKALDRWEKRLNDIFDGQPYDMYDAALADTVSIYPVDIQPFKDMIDGMRMDLKKSRYQTFDELYLYCYYVAGTVGLMSVPVMGIAPESKATTENVYTVALALGIANQLTNILRDVGEEWGDES